MKVEDLIETLKELDQESEVMLVCQRGYPYQFEVSQVKQISAGEGEFVVYLSGETDKGFIPQAVVRHLKW